MTFGFVDRGWSSVELVGLRIRLYTGTRVRLASAGFRPVCCPFVALFEVGGSRLHTAALHGSGCLQVAPASRALQKRRGRGGCKHLPVSQRDDVARFERRAGSYETGPLGHWPRLVAERTAEIALQAVPSPRAVLDVGCGTGVLLRLLAERVRGQVPLLGVDPSPAMITEGHAVRDLDGGCGWSRGVRRTCRSPTIASTSLSSSVSFDHWADQSGSARGGARSRSRRSTGACRSLRPVAGDHHMGRAATRSYACGRGAAARPGAVTANDLATGIQLGPSAACTSSGGGERLGVGAFVATTAGMTNRSLLPPRSRRSPCEAAKSPDSSKPVGFRNRVVR